MIIAAALCPAAPLLVRELTGTDPVVPDLRAACVVAAAELGAAAPDVIAIVGVADHAATWNAGWALDMAVFAPRAQRQASTWPPAGTKSSPDMPPALGIGGWLLDQVGCDADRILRSVAHDEPADGCAHVGATLASARERVALLVMADGSARRSRNAPGYLDERSAAFDASVEDAIRGGRLDALLSLDASLAQELMATGRPAWQVLAGALRGRKVTSDVRYSDDPFGVAYMVASIRVGYAEQRQAEQNGERDARAGRR
jgi:hypothetical protein